MRHRFCCLACLTLLCVAAPAHADWPAQGKPVLYVLQSHNGIISAQILETPSGDLMVVGEGRGSNGAGWNAVQVTRDGDLAPGWTLTGTCLGTSSFSYGAALHGLAMGNTGELWHVRRPSSGTQGLNIVPPTSPLSTYCSAGQLEGIGTGAAGIPGSSDGYIVTGQSTVKRLTSSGGTAAGWPAGGVVAMQGRDSGLELDPCLLPDGAGGVVVLEMTADGPVVSRVDGNAARHAGWPAAGLPLGGPPSCFFLSLPVWRLLPSGPDHVLALWVEAPDCSGPLRAKMQRIGFDGTLDPAWPAGGLEVVALGVNEDVTLVADGEGGAHVLWESGGLPRGTHVRPSGSFYPGLDAQGRLLLPNGAPYVRLKPASPYWLNSSSDVPYLVADRGLDAGLVFVWSEPTDPTQNSTRTMRVRWLRADLTPEPAEPDAGLLVLDDSGNSFAAVQRAAHADGAGGIFLAWESFLGDPPPVNDWTLAMTRVSRPSITGVPSSVATSAFALGGAMPNPVRGSVSLRCTLPDERTARLEVFDAGGRRWRSAIVSGAGEHSLRFDDLGELPPGLYLARLALGGETRTSRFVKLR